MDVRVALFEADYYARQSLKFLLARDPRTRVVREFDSLPENDVDNSLKDVDALLISNTCLPSGSAGTSAISRLHTFLPNVAIVLLVSDSATLPVTALLTAGVNGILMKDEMRDGIASAIARAAQGELVITASVEPHTRNAHANLRSRVKVLPHVTKYRELTERLMQTIYLYGVAGMSKKEIADELKLSTNSVRGYVQLANEIIKASDQWEAFTRLTALDDEIKPSEKTTGKPFATPQKR